MATKFRAHETFFIRKGWLSKGMRYVSQKPDVFTDKDDNPMDVLGIGANMVKSLRYCLHYKLVTDEEMAPSWYYFFNKFAMKEFSKDDFIAQIQNELKMDGTAVAIRSLTDDFTCIVNTYVPRYKSDPNKVSPENNINCPFGELGLIDILSKERGNYTYKKR